MLYALDYIKRGNLVRVEEQGKYFDWYGNVCNINKSENKVKVDFYYHGEKKDSQWFNADNLHFVSE